MDHRFIFSVFIDIGGVADELVGSMVSGEIDKWPFELWCLLIFKKKKVVVSASALVSTSVHDAYCLGCTALCSNSLKVL